MSSSFIQIVDDDNHYDSDTDVEDVDIDPEIIVENSSSSLLQSVVLNYPPSDPECASIYGQHLSRLNPNQNLNDELIRFGIKYTLSTLIPEAIRSNLLLFDPTFSQLKRFSSLNTNGRVKFLNKYTLTPNIEYLIIPWNVMSNNFHDGHWFLVLVTELEEMFTTTTKKKFIQPSIVFMDSDVTKVSLNSYRTICSAIRDYLTAAYCRLHSGADVIIRFKRHIPKLPLQETEFDCGLFTIEYLRYYFENESLLRPWLLSGSKRSPKKPLPRLSARYVTTERRADWAQIILQMLEPQKRQQLIRVLGWDAELENLKN